MKNKRKISRHYLGIIILFCIGVLEFIPFFSSIFNDFIHFFTPHFLSIGVFIVFMVLFFIKRRAEILLLALIIFITILFRFNIRQKCNHLIYVFNKDRSNKVALFSGVKIKTDEERTVYFWSCLLGTNNELIFEEGHGLENVEEIEIYYIIDDDWYNRYTLLLE